MELHGLHPIGMAVCGGADVGDERGNRPSVEGPLLLAGGMMLFPSLPSSRLKASRPRTDWSGVPLRASGGRPVSHAGLALGQDGEFRPRVRRNASASRRSPSDPAATSTSSRL